MPDIIVNGVRLVYDTHGDPAKPPLFMIHGLYGNRHLGPMIDVFADDYRVIAYDARGHGDSDKPAHYTLEDHGRDLLELISALGYEKANVMGISMGSYIAAQAAILDSSRIDKLVLVVTKGHGKTSSVLRYLTGKGLNPADMDQEQLVAAMEDAIWSTDTSPERRQQIMDEQQAALPEGTKELTADEKRAVDEALANFDLRPGLGNITVPTLVVSGRDDGLNPPDMGREVADLIPGSTFLVFDHSGHMLVAEEPQRLKQEVDAFLSAPAGRDSMPS